MESNWKICQLQDIVIFNPKETLKKGTLAKKITMDMLKPFCRDIITFEFSEFNGGTKFRNNDTIMARITPCLENGKTAKVNILEDNEIGFGSTEYIVFRAIENISNDDFIYYLICSSIVREPAIKSMVGSSGRQRVQIDVLKNLKINIPDLETQCKIGSLLRFLDEKIALNDKINQNLEQQAQAIFKSWFVDFEPFGGVMPDDWKKGNLLDIADYLNGLAMQKYRPKNNEIALPVLKIRELRQGICDANSELCSVNIKSEYIIQNGDVIFSWSGSLLVDFWCGGKCGLNQHLFKVTSKKYDKWFYYSWTKYHLDNFINIAKDMATTMGHIKREELKKSVIFIPNTYDYQKIHNLLKPIYDMIIHNRIENQYLSTIRDSLLPKLMNGEIDVSKIKI
ncbi:MAG: restriction endonuclease subunit S [Oscillospiraceae bacterium]|nr:restriction endonuclease subunit S [Oscillospiraceae bacterium]